MGLGPSSTTFLRKAGFLKLKTVMVLSGLLGGIEGEPIGRALYKTIELYSYKVWSYLIDLLSSPDELQKSSKFTQDAVF